MCVRFYEEATGKELREWEPKLGGHVRVVRKEKKKKKKLTEEFQDTIDTSILSFRPFAVYVSPERDVTSR